MLSLDLTEIDVFQGELKTLSKTNFEKLRKEILETGYAFAMHVWQEPKTNRWKLVDGTQRFRTITHLVTKEGYECGLLPVVPVAADDYKQAKRRVLQGTSQYGEMTGEGLYEFMTDAELQFDELDAFRLPDIDIDDFREEFEEQTGGHSEEDEVPEVKPDDKRVKLGDLFILGEHRLLCGDSTDKSQVDRLMNGEKADMVFTDPPYGISYENTKGGIMGDGSLKVFEGACNLIPTLVKEKVHAYIFFGVQKTQESLEILNKYMKQFNILVMPITHQNKPGPDGYFNSNYELCFFTNINGVKKHNSGAAKVSESTMNDARYSGDGFLERYKALGNEVITEHNLKTVHPTEKKVSGISFYLSISSNLNDLVLDLFGGSGSTLIACEKTKRKCFMMEIDPTYCSVILDRWAKFTSLDPVREDGKKWSEIV